MIFLMNEVVYPAMAAFWICQEEEEGHDEGRYASFPIWVIAIPFLGYVSWQSDRDL